MVFINFADSTYSFFKRENGKRVGFRRVKINKNLHKSYNLAQKTDIKMQRYKKQKKTYASKTPFYYTKG